LSIRKPTMVWTTASFVIVIVITRFRFWTQRIRSRNLSVLYRCYAFRWNLFFFSFHKKRAQQSSQNSGSGEPVRLS